MDNFFYWIHHFLEQHTMLAPSVYIILHVLFAVFLIPCSPMTILAGTLWGKWMGFVISMLSAMISSCVTFGLARYFLKNKIHTFLIKRYAKTDWVLEQTKKHGWKFIASVQLNPSVPSSTFGYLFGLSNIDLFKYAVLSMIFMLPLQILLIVIGDSFSKTLVSNISWMIASITLIIFTYYLYKIFFKNKQMD